MFDYVYYDKIVEGNRILEKLPTANDIEEIAPLYWADHCLECSPPACYSSCKMFKENEFGRCKRLQYIYREKIDGFGFPAYKIKFKKWAKLRCLYNSKRVYCGMEKYLNEYKQHQRFVNIAKVFDYPFKILPRRYNNPISRLIHHKYIKRAIPILNNNQICDDFVLVFWADRGVSNKLILDSHDANDLLLARNVWDIKQGLNIWRISTNLLTRNDSQIYALELYPADNAEVEITVLLSDLITFSNKSNFLKNKQVSVKNNFAQKVKCVAWDLDNTIWNGIIGEDGVTGVKIRPEVVEVIKKFDERGILNTICSKNDAEIALDGLRRFGIEEYFLYPQINWDPKSKNLQKISQLLNINIDTFAFIDDSHFERNEVKNALGCVRVFPETEIEDLLSKPEFDVLVTEDSRNRRAFYKAEEQRQVVLSECIDSDYKSFILSCEFIIDIEECKEKKDIDRCHELLMRTNQLNASTNRISYKDFIAIVDNPNMIVIRVKCHDKYGEYGTVGCIILQKSDNVLLCTDFVVSCRVAKKKVESAVIMYLMKTFKLPMNIIYKPSDRNHVLLEEFMNIGGIYDEMNEVVQFTTDNICDYDWACVKGL